MITYQIEKWADFLRDAEPLFPLHWEELALDQGRIPMGINAEKYQEAERTGILLIITVRSDGELVGYLVAGLLPHMHYKDAGVMAHTDMYFLKREFRNGPCGLKFLMFFEEVLRELGIVKAYISSKLHLDHSELFKRLGWRPSDVVFTKFLGEAHGNR